MTEMAFAARTERPLPVPDADSQPFWDALRDNHLLIQRCSSCSLLRFPPSALCHHCRSWDAEWVEVTGGTVQSWVVVEYGVIKSLREQAPYVVALIDLGDGAQMPSNIYGVPPDELYLGMPVSVRFQEIGGGFTIPVFVSEESTDAAA
jgi:hypothetical protein